MRETKRIRRERINDRCLSATAAVAYQNLVVLVPPQSLALSHMHWSHHSDPKFFFLRLWHEKICCGFKTTDDQRQSKNWSGSRSGTVSIVFITTVSVTLVVLCQAWSQMSWLSNGHETGTLTPTYICDMFCKNGLNSDHDLQRTVSVAAIETWIRGVRPWPSKAFRDCHQNRDHDHCHKNVTFTVTVATTVTKKLRDFHKKMDQSGKNEGFSTFLHVC